MSKCGKGCMPECEYFTTGGCISPFNCMYRIEELSPSSATSISSSYVQNLISENAALKSENAELRATLSKLETVEKELRARLDNAVELPCKVGDTVYSVFEFPNEKTVLKGTCKHININICSGFPEIFIKLVFETNEQLFLRTYSGNDLNNIFLLRSEAEARLEELKGDKNDR